MSGAGEAWHRIGPLASIPVGEGRAYAAAGRRVAVFRPRGGGVAAAQADCPHRGGPLADGIVGDGVVVCPLHSRRFALADGQGDDGACAIAVHPCRVDAEGDVHVALPSAVMA